MILGVESQALGVPSQVMVARWAMKLAMVGEYVQPRHSRYFVQAERAAFKNGGMPFGATVWIGKYSGANNGVHHSASGLFTDPATRRINGHMSTFAIGQLLVQVFVERSAPDHPIAVRPGPWEETLLEIWPPLIEHCTAMGGAIVWPPPRSLDDGGFEAAFRRFALGE